MDCVTVSNGNPKAAAAFADADEDGADVRLAEQQLRHLLSQLSAVGGVQQNAAIVDQVFALVLGQPDGQALSAEQFGVLEAFATELACSEQPVAAHACFEHLLHLQKLHQLHHQQQQPPNATPQPPSPPPTAPHLNRLRTAHNLDNVRHQLVERWHFRMLNDRQRNRGYKAAIQAAVADYRRHRSAGGDSATAMRVLDIGTGTGLLAMYAHQAGAGAVFACDESPVMADIAGQTFARCAPERPPVIIRQHSTRMVAEDLRHGLGDLVDPRCDLIVTETLDAGAFGEGILQTLLHAHEQLLRPGGRVIPAGVQLYIAGFESRTVALEQVGLNMDFGDVVYMRGSQLRAKNGGPLEPPADSSNDCRNGGAHCTPPAGNGCSSNGSGTPATDEPYDSDTVHNIRDFRLITRVQPAFACDFQSAEDIRSALSGEREENVSLHYTQIGNLDGFVVWFRLQLDAEHSLCTAPPDEALKADASATASSSSSATSAAASAPATCWEQAVFKLNARFANGERLQSLNVGVSCAGGRLQLQHYYSGSSRRAALAVPPDTVRFVNDAEYLTRLEYEFNAAVGCGPKAKQPSPAATGNILDLCPFPHIGFSLVKGRAASRLYCSADIEQMLRFVAAANCVDANSALHFVDGLQGVWQLPAEVRFDAILLAPISGELGVLDAEQVRAYERLRRERLVEGGRMVPHRVEVWGQLVRSEWLQRVTRVMDGGKAEEDGADDELQRWGIATAMNRFATRQQLGLGFFEHDCVSGAFRVADVRWGEGAEDERYVLVRLPQEVAERDLHGMLCFYKVWLMAESEEPISTRRFASHVRRMCYVLDAEELVAAAGGGGSGDGVAATRMTSRAVVQVRQHDGLLECSLYRRGQGGSGKCAVLSNGSGGGGAGGGGGHQQQ